MPVASGVGSSSIFITSGSPNSLTTIAFINKRSNNDLSDYNGDEFGLANRAELQHMMVKEINITKRDT